MLSNEEERLNVTYSWPLGKIGGGRYIATGFSVCPSGLLSYLKPFWSEIVFCTFGREFVGSYHVNI
jgi:hypothetical protein